MSGKFKFIINLSVEYFAVNHSNIVLSNEQKDVIKQFLENVDSNILTASYNRSQNNIQYDLDMPNDKSECLIFYKIPKSNEMHKPTMGGNSNQLKHTLGILTVEGGLLKSIYNSVSRVFLPQVEAECTTELSCLIKSLHESLSTALGFPKDGVATIFDEIKFWENKLNKFSMSQIKERRATESIINRLKNMAEQLSSLEKSTSGTIVEEFLASAHGNFDDLWRLQPQYSEERMAALMDYIGEQLINVYLNQMLEKDIWNLSKPILRSLVNQCIDTADSWLELCDSLTRLFWPNYAEHIWHGNAHVPKRVKQFRERILEIQKIRDLYDQIVILTDDINVQSPFEGFDIYDTSPKGCTQWAKALEQFEKMLQPLDECIARAIKKQLHKHSDNARQLIVLFTKHAALIQRPNVLELLTIEMEQFVQSLQVLINNLHKEINTVHEQRAFENLSVMCNECRWLKIIHHQIMEIDKITHLIAGCGQYDKFMKSLLDIKEDTESLLKKNFEIWCNKFTNAVQKDILRLREDQPVVEFEQGSRQLMRVTFNPQLIALCQDVRELENLGFTVPPEIRKATMHASKYISYARLLQQIACFYNTIGDRMIPCQRPIMLKNAKEFSKLIHSKTVSWQDEKSVEEYVNSLQRAVSRLLIDNNLLIRHHEEAKNIVIKLMNIDLINQSQMWKEEMRHLRTLFISLEHQGFTNLETFILHWDHQLYKAAELQFVLGLLSMNNKLPNVYTKIAFRQRRLCFIPSEEDMRREYFSQLHCFIQRFYEFRGLSDKTVNLYRKFVDSNCHYFGPLYTKAVELFEKLTKFKQLWLPWVALGCVDVSELCDIHLQTSEDWERNFRQCKYFGQKIAKIERNEVSIGCFVIDMGLLCSDIEGINRRYWQTLIHCLKSSIIVDVNYIREFVENALEFLQNASFDQSSLTSANEKYEQIKMELPNVQNTLISAKAKDECLASWCKENVSALTDQIMQWEKLQSLIENHSVVFQRHLELIKSQALGQLDNIISESEKFMLRWNSTIQYLETNENATLDLFTERLKHWQEILERKTFLLQECQKMNIQLPLESIQTLDEMDEQIKKESLTWLVCDDYLKEFAVIQKEEWTIYRCRPFILQEFINKWESQVLDDSYDESSKRIRQHVERIKSVLPVLRQLQSEALTDRHWMDILNALGRPTFKAVHEITLGDILEDSMALQRATNEIHGIVKQASSEQTIRQALNELDRWSVTTLLKTITHRDSLGQSVTLIKDYTETVNKIFDNQSLLESARDNDVSDTFSDQLQLWEQRFNNLNIILNALNQSQKRWIYLEPIFGAGTLRNEEGLFKQIDKDFRLIMSEVKADSHVMHLTKINNIISIVTSLETQLKRCQSKLVSYIMEKRNLFPRFYFMSDDDLLEMLGQGNKTPEVIQKHIKKIFPGCHALNIMEESSGNGRTRCNINAFVSSDGDILKLKQSVEIKGPIEDWLNTLVSTMQQTLKKQIFECCTSYLSEGFNEQFLEKYVEQVLIITRAVQFTKQVENAIQAMSLQNLLQQLNEEMKKYSMWKLNSGKWGSQTKLLQIKLRALMYDVAHYITIVEQLLEHNVMHLNNWYWLANLKFYLNGNADNQGQVILRIVYGEFKYSYEFLGNPDKLVYTRLTHKCYLTLTQALQMGLGGNPFGPAGTGKTECVKALGAMLGRLVLVFNCDENVDTNSMTSILIGLARCGAWGCFDEFNRLQEVTLSSISTLIQPIQAALRDKCHVVQVSDITVELNHNCGIFVTLNPASTEYGGRQNLPRNLQALFRQIVMQQPDQMEIARVILCVEGFRAAKEIAERVVELYDMCSKILTKQRHYDWGLRELKTVLLACSKEAHPEQKLDGKKLGDEQDNFEIQSVFRALHTSIVSKLIYQDVKPFNVLLENVFPDIELTVDDNVDDINLKERITEAFHSLGLYVCDRQLYKVMQLQKQLQTRMGVTVMGPPGCGKTTIITVLQKALTAKYGQQIRVHTINPKSMSRVQLLGYLDTDTRQWFDGILTYISNIVSTEPITLHSWIVCDGSIDPQWIESLNSVLDDNRLLSLPSGWRIQFGKNVNFIFETDNVKNASPATISRMGIVNISREDYPLEFIVKHNLTKIDYGEIVQSYLEELYEPIIRKIEKQFFSELSFLTRANMIRALILHLQIYNDDTNLNAVTREQFVVAVCQVLWSYLPKEEYHEWVQHLLDKIKLYALSKQQPELLYFNKITNSIELYKDEDSAILHNLKGELFQTATIKMYLDQIKRFLCDSKSSPFILMGPPGSAKSLLLKTAVNELAGYNLLTINCSAQLTTTHIIYKLKQNLNLHMELHGQTLKAKNTRLILYLKNLDLCHIDEWDCNSITELLLQLVQRKGFYNITDSASSNLGNNCYNIHGKSVSSSINNLEWVNVSGIQICSSISITKLLNYSIALKITPRYLAINHILRINEPSNTDMLKVLHYKLSIILMDRQTITNAEEKELQQSINHSVLQRTQYIAEYVLNFYNELQTTFNHEGNKQVNTQASHASIKSTTTHSAFYQFSPKLLFKVLANLKYYPKDAFNEALQCELFSIFEGRMVSEADAGLFTNIFKRVFPELPTKQNAYFIPGYANRLESVAYEEWREELQKHINVCNSESFAIDAPLTNELMDLTAKLARLIVRPNSHILLIGPAGGRQLDALHLVASMKRIQIHLLNGDHSYGLQEFHNELKLLMQTSALENQYNCLVIEHNWLMHIPDLMKPLDALLGESDILDLFGDDLQSIITALQQSAHLEGYQDSLLSFFIKRIQENFHLIICLDSDNEKLNDLLVQYPALYRRTEIICIKPLSRESYTFLPKKFIEELKQLSINPNENIEISNNFNAIIESVLLKEAPIKFYQLIKTYYVVYKKSSSDINKRLVKLQGGVEKLGNAHAMVEDLKEKALGQEKILAEKRELAKEALDMISSTMRNASHQKSNMLELKKQTQINSEKLKRRQAEIQKELADVKPILAEATAAVGQIKSEALSEIRSLRAPPEIIRDILEGVLRLMGVKDTSWNSMKTFLAKRGVKEDIRSMEPTRISPEHCTAVEKLLNMKPESFELKNAKRASSAAAPLAAWVKASVRYSRVLQSIKPLEVEQAQLKNNLEMAEDKLQSLVTGLDDVDNQVKELSNKLNVHTQEGALLELKLKEAHQTLKDAESLLQQLSTEYKSWSLQLTEHQELFNNLDEQSLIISVILNYYFRLINAYGSTTLEQLISKLNLSDSLNIRKCLVTEQEEFMWETLGLIKDTQIIESAGILSQILELPFSTVHSPVLIDPTGAALNWLIEYLKWKERSFDVITQSNPRLTYVLELAVRFGKVLILQDIQELHELKPPLMQFIANRMYMKYGKKRMDVAGKLIDLDERFQIIFITKSSMQNLKSHQNILAYLTVIPFTITTIGLSDQLISKSIQIKNPTLEDKRIQLLKNEGSLLQQRLNLEDELLKELSQAEGDILQNEKLLKSLREIKESTMVIDESLRESHLIRQTISTEHSFLHDICNKCATFYMTLSNNHYLSVDVFIRIFSNLLDSSDININTYEAIQSKFYISLVSETFQYMARSFNSEGHLPLALNICRCAFKESIDDYEWELFVTDFSGIHENLTVSEIGQISEIFSKDKILKVQLLIQHKPALANILQLNNSSLWCNFLNGLTKEVPVTLPNHFQYLLLTQILRPDLMTFYMRSTIEHLLNMSTEFQRQPTIEQILKESSNEKVVLILTKGDVDPSTEIFNAAAQRNTNQNPLYQELAVGRGMEKELWCAIEEASGLGKWLCLKNVHLIPEWLRHVNSRLREFDAASDFRLWLISETSDTINEQIKSQFVTVLYENSIGIKQKAKRLFQKYVNIENTFALIKEPRHMKIRVALFLLISVLQDRCYYVPQGWSKCYDFGEADVRVSLQLMKWFDKCLESNRTDWKIMQKLSEYVSFGGQISNSRDILILKKYLEIFFSNNIFKSRWTPFDNKIVIPNASQWSEYLNALNEMSIEDNLEILKLSTNLKAHKELQYGKEIVKELRFMFFDSSGSENESHQKIEQHLKPIFTLWRKLVSSINSTSLLHNVKTNNTSVTEIKMNVADNCTTPWSLFLNSEFKLACLAYRLIHSILGQVYEILKNKRRLLRNNSIVNVVGTYQVPIEWQRLWNGPSNILDYLKAFMKRASAAETRYLNCQQLEFAAEIDLSTVFSACNFFATLKLVTSHKLRASCTCLIMDSECITHGSTSHKNRSKVHSSFQCLLKPLFLDGAIFSKDYLVVPSNDTVVSGSTTTPEFMIYFIEKDPLKDAKSLDNHVQLPLYTNETRKELLCELNVPSKETTDTVLLSGAALFIGY